MKVVKLKRRVVLLVAAVDQLMYGVVAVLEKNVKVDLIMQYHNNIVQFYLMLTMLTYC